MAFANVKIETSEIVTDSRIFLNGVDISNYVNGYHVSQKVGEISKITLDVLADIDIETNGEVTINPILIVDTTSILDNAVSRTIFNAQKSNKSELIKKEN